MMPRALIFDVDGTLADTEEAQRQAFNAAFRHHGLPWQWSVPRYAALFTALPTGKERIVRHIQEMGLPTAEEGALLARVAAVHLTKSDFYARALAAGRVPLRPGIARLLRDAREAGLRLAIATHGTRAHVHALLRGALGSGASAWFSVIGAGDAVGRRKPEPDIYAYVLDKLGVPATECVAFEDSARGLNAATAAGIPTIVTPTRWTADQDFSRAALLLPSLGDAENPVFGRLGASIRAHQFELDHLPLVLKRAAPSQQMPRRAAPMSLAIHA